MVDAPALVKAYLALYGDTYVPCPRCRRKTAIVWGEDEDGIVHLCQNCYYKWVKTWPEIDEVLVKAKKFLVREVDC